MVRVLIIVVMLNFMASFATAQDVPLVTAELEETETVIGQPLVLRIKILVPTWLPQPPEFPSLDIPGLLVRLPERASGPVTEQVGAESWSGVQRAYRLYPLQPGRFDIPGQRLTIIYAKPGESDPVTAEVALDPISFTATVPDGARGLDPLIVATEFTLEASIEGSEQLDVGGAIVRTLVATISGTTPILIPRLTPEEVQDNLRTYSDEPSVADKEDRGDLSGTRTERTTYLATSEGTAEIPAVRIEWFNLDTGKVETAEVPGLSVSIAAGEAGPENTVSISWRDILLTVLVVLAVVLVLRMVRPRLSVQIRILKDRWRASEPFASRQVLDAIRRKDLGEVYSAIDTWSGFFPGSATDDLQAALALVGQARHGPATGTIGTRAWAALRHTFETSRQSARRANRRATLRNDLKPLNPS
jgi:hypothetical protein